MSRAGQVYLFDSNSGQAWPSHSPMLAGAAEHAAEFAKVMDAVVQPNGSRKLKQKYGTVIDGVTCAVRPFDMLTYAFATVVNTYHHRAIRVKVKDIVGRPWMIEGESDGAKKVATDFLNGVFEGRSFGSGLADVWTDYEGLGNGYLEIVPDLVGKPARFTHLPAPEMWIRMDGLGYVQQMNGEYSHFRKFGLAPEAFGELKTNDPLRAEKITSVKHFSRYFPISPFYGIPCIMPAWSALSLFTLVAEYNTQFFANSAVPDYAVVLKGTWGDDAAKVIREKFERHLKGQHHKTLTLETPEGGEVKFEKLTGDTREGSHRLLRQDTRDELLHAHGVPPQKVGIVETGKLGGNLASEQEVTYRDSIVTPGQEHVEGGINPVLAALDLDVKLKFERYAIDDRDKESQIDERYLRARVVTPNEVRAQRYPQFEPLDGGDEPLTAAPAFADPAAAALDQIQQAIQAVTYE
jgi:phage portal protein BeeE